jgi:FAD/FMN-containing dehydrogenase
MYKMKKIIDVTSLKKNFSGEIFLPGDSLYEQKSTTLMRKGIPAVIMQPQTAEDVIVAIRYARDNNLVLSVRSGGHSGPGFGTNIDGLVIDLSNFDTVTILDKEKGLVRVGAGAQWITVAKELQEQHLAISSGDTMSVGVGGLTLGAGIGWMVRQYGLAIDNLVAAEVVTADGKILRASSDENADLFWAIRGGGGNFGVVTNFEFIAHPVGKVYAGHVTYKVDNLTELLTGWRDYMRLAPKELTTMLLLMPAMRGNPPAVTILCCYNGADKSAAMNATNPLLQLGDLVSQDIKEKEYAEVLEEAHVPPGVRIITNNGFIKDLSDEVIQAIVTQSKAGIILQIRSVGGAMNEIDKDATAFAHRDSEALFVSPVFVPLSASENDVHMALKPWEAIAAFTSGAYVNFFTEVTDKEIEASYPEGTYQRLKQIKKIYDPENIFHQNYNIDPTEQ